MPNNRTSDRFTSTSVPPSLRLSADVAWRATIVLVAIALVVTALVMVKTIVLPFMLAVVLASGLAPAVAWLRRHRVPKWVAVFIVEITAILVLAALVWLIVNQLAHAVPQLRQRALVAFTDLQGALTGLGVPITDGNISSLIDEGLRALQNNTGAVWTQLTSIGTSAKNIGEGVFIVLFSTLFLLADGRTIWAWTVRLLPQGARVPVDTAGRSAWATLSRFLQVQLVVAAVNAVGIGLGAALLGVPLAVPIAIAVFLGSFIPFVGAIVTGAMAAGVALVFNGWVVALVMLAVVIVVHQAESHILQPLLMGSAVKIHPLAVFLGVLLGTELAGIPGAFFAVVIIATINAFIRSIVASHRATATSVTSSADGSEDTTPKLSTADVPVPHEPTEQGAS